MLEGSDPTSLARAGIKPIVPDDDPDSVRKHESDDADQVDDDPDDSDELDIDAALAEIDADEESIDVDDDDDDIEKYNPDQPRDERGRFGSGGGGAPPQTAATRSAARVERAKATVERAAARVDRAKSKIVAAKAVHAAANAQAKAAVRAAAKAAATAKSSLKQKDIKAADVARRKAERAQAKVDKAKAAVDKHTATHATAKQTHQDARSMLKDAKAGKPPASPPSKPPIAPPAPPTVPPAPPARRPEAEPPPAVRQMMEARARLNAITNAAPKADGSLLEAVGNGAVRDAEGRVVGLNADAQRAMREHFDNVVSQYGLVRRPAEQSHVIETRTKQDMGGAAGWHYNNGKIVVSQDGMRNLVDHARSETLTPDHFSHIGESVASGRSSPGFDQYETMVHETIHERGPHIDHLSNPDHYRMAEELSTEMSAREIAARAHGIAGHQIGVGAYHDMIEGAVRHVAEENGVSRAQAFEAVAKSALDFKAKNGRWLADAALGALARGSMTHLGNHDSAAHQRVLSKWHEEAAKVGRVIDKLKAD